ncbi:MAG TPA: endonuclease/exonuclease/phosphatase family protein [Gemmataceae bacterium]|nr:endonuclease/exonuclease/phosphatase family protein [Gemmataceae bacterium]
MSLPTGETPVPPAPIPPAGLPKRGWRRAGMVVAVCSWLYLFVVLVLWGLLYEADVWWPATLLMFSPRWLLLLPAIVLLPAAAALRRRMLGVQLITLVLIAGPLMNFRISGQFLQSPPAGLPLRVMTCNLHYKKPDEASLKRLLAETRPDIIALQEWKGLEQSPLFAGSEWHVHAAPSLFLASRLPIRRATQLGKHSMNKEGAVLRYELETSAGVITLFSLHLASPRQGLYESIHTLRKGVAELEAGSELRWEQCENLAQEAEQVSGPVLLVGDFNTPPESVLFRQVWDRYTDAFSVAGWGWGYTFIGNRTAVCIDHILTDPDWHCRRCWVGPPIGSPHRPVLADLILPATSADR